MSIALTGVLLLGGITAAWLAWRLDVLDRPSALLLAVATIPVSFYVYLRRWMRNVPALSWRSLATSDVHSAIYFVPACLLSWGSLLGTTLDGWQFWTAIIAATVIHMTYTFDIFLRLPHVATRIIDLTDKDAPLSPEHSQQIRELFFHKVKCGRRDQEQEEKRRRIFAQRCRRAAIARRHARHADTVYVRYPRAVQTLMWRCSHEFADTSTWLSASLASAGLFPALASVAAPGPAGALFLISPFFLIPVAAAIRRQLHQRYGHRGSGATFGRDVSVVSRA